MLHRYLVFFLLIFLTIPAFPQADLNFKQTAVDHLRKGQLNSRSISTGKS